MRIFQLHRETDPFNVTGTGHVADGVEFDDGTVVVRWRTATPSTVDWASMADAERVHGHEGSTTRFVFVGYDGRSLGEAPPARGFGTYVDLTIIGGPENPASPDAVWIYVGDGNTAVRLHPDAVVAVRDRLDAFLYEIGHPATWRAS